MRLQKSTSSFFQSRSFSGQSSHDASPAASPPVEKAGFLATPESQHEYNRPLSPKPQSRPSSRLRNGSPPSPQSNRKFSGLSTGNLDPSSGETGEKKGRRRSWFGRSKSTERTGQGPAAWVLGLPGPRPYDMASLIGAEHVSEVWDDSSDCLVYLFPRMSGKGPSFRIDSSLLASSKILSEMILPLEKEMTKVDSSDPHTPPMTPKSISGLSEYQLFMPIALISDSTLSSPTSSLGLSDDEETLIATRNLFAFLTGQFLVATESSSSAFAVLMKLSETLKQYGFSNLDGSTFGEVATSRFDSYVDQLGLADVRSSPEKTIEGIVLGERMKNIKLYNETFTHAAGKHGELLTLASPKYRLISPITCNRLSRAAMDLKKRTASVRHTFEDFDFPSIYSGSTLTSKTAEERKEVNFDALRESFFVTRKFVMAFYKSHYGSWPPKASKRNDFETSGLNRIVCQSLYRDLCAMYDLLVDRTMLTNRTADGVSIDDRNSDLPHIRVLRATLSEYDRSSPPVKPPIPFDCPIMPSLRQTRSSSRWGDAKKEAKAMTKKLKDDEIAEIMTASHNADVPPSMFLTSFREAERKAARNCTIKELLEIRMGQWLFMYAALQALPMVCVDGPQLRYTNVEYFLCEPPRFGVPWAREDALRDISGVGIARAGGIAHLPADLFHHGAEGIYLRSHCWQMAEKWSTGNPLTLALHPNLQAKTPSSASGIQTSSRRIGGPESNVQSWTAVGLGLEVPSMTAIALKDRTSPARPASVYDPNLTFDSILGGSTSGAGRKKK